MAQLDVCWLNVGGENPVDYIRKYAGSFELRTLRKGIQDFKAIVAASKESGAEWFIVVAVG